MLVILAGLLGLVGFVCAVIILIDAFKNEVWKGVVGLICGLYLLYYAFTEFQNPNKPLILAGYLIGILGGIGLNMMAAASAMSHAVVR